MDVRPRALGEPSPLPRRHARWVLGHQSITQLSPVRGNEKIAKIFHAISRQISSAKDLTCASSAASWRERTPASSTGSANARRAHIDLAHAHARYTPRPSPTLAMFAVVDRGTARTPWEFSLGFGASGATGA